MKASGQPGEGRCKATVQGRDRLEAETCLQEFLCEGCEFDYECKLAWEPRLGEETIRDWSRASVWAEEPLEQCL
ncbi:MAG TPA: hypothetical protein HA252_01855 [Candidatus Diapherotrites archaeon]|uniref:Uncharacterized protein n=1 Tax=Candidatus Iainarchaeum sp. TaxID=3101447 RepID=A0A7J4JEJ1_9ARCH|nr:hypothetical protein [Candidatus Diapherotrites archaeon]